MGNSDVSRDGYNKAKRLAAAKATLNAIFLVVNRYDNNQGTHLPLVAQLIASCRDLEIVFSARYSDLDILRISPDLCHSKSRNTSMLFLRGDSEVLQALIYDIRNNFRSPLR